MRRAVYLVLDGHLAHVEQELGNGHEEGTHAAPHQHQEHSADVAHAQLAGVDVLGGRLSQASRGNNSLTPHTLVPHSCSTVATRLRFQSSIIALTFYRPFLE